MSRNQTTQSPFLFCFGFGSSAQALARDLKESGKNWRIEGTCRSVEKQTTLSELGFKAHLFDGQEVFAGAPELLAQVTHILVSVPPKANAGARAEAKAEMDPVARTFGELLTALPALQWVGYLSTTGVYGDHQGGRVDELTPRTPAGPRGQLRVDAEEAWETLFKEQGLPLHIFRLAGIYGPHSSQLKSLKSGKARRIVKQGQVFSRIHVDDIAAVLAASMEKPNPGAIYNVCDNEAAPPQDVVAYAADLMGQAAPPEVLYEDADLTPMARSFYGESKRVDNHRMINELGVVLKHPTYKEGLKALFEAQQF
ncbi:MAG: SDR family oxidoreductase [Parvibaculaceae bacterium]|nr:SDR family oxidoreductase [Parvibaculaceae bacterium]